MSRRAVKTLKGLMPAALRDWLRKTLIPYPFDVGLNRDPSERHQKRALISYLSSFNLGAGAPVWHTNLQECPEIVKCFIDLGFRVDLAWCLDPKLSRFRVPHRYDVVFGLGEPFYAAAMANPRAVKIIYLTECHPGYAERQEMARVEYYRKRHGRSAPVVRAGWYYEKRHISVADFGVLLGNEMTRSTYPELKDRLFILPPTALRHEGYVHADRDFVRTRKNFVWFGSYGAVHKGLDILLDVFADLPGCHLYICGLRDFDGEFLEPGGLNIHDMGHVEVASDRFLWLMRECSYVILPSCAEGMNTGVLTCMSHGLVPVITKETGVDLWGNGFYIEDWRVPGLRDAVLRCAHVDSGALKALHDATFSGAQGKFTVAQFGRDFSAILGRILSVP